jgi:hypothetical protein
MFIYNTKSSLTKSALDKLAIVSSLSQEIDFRCGEDDDEEDQPRSPQTPDFVWVVRDFSLKTTSTAEARLREFMENEQNSDEEEDQADHESTRVDNNENQTRSKIQQLKVNFNSMKSFYLPSPVSDGTGGHATLEEALQSIDSIPFHELRPTFIEEYRKLLALLRGSLRVKTVNNRAVNGPVFVEFLRATIEAINANEIVSITDAFIRSIKTVAEETLTSIRSHYKTEMNIILNSFTPERPVSTSFLQSSHERIFKECVKTLEQKLGRCSSLILEENQQIFKEFVEEELNKFVCFNRESIKKLNADNGNRIWVKFFKGKLDLADFRYQSREKFNHDLASFKRELSQELFECEDSESFLRDLMIKVEGRRFETVAAQMETHFVRIEKEMERHGRVNLETKYLTMLAKVQESERLAIARAAEKEAELNRYKQKSEQAIKELLKQKVEAEASRVESYKLDEANTIIQELRRELMEVKARSMYSSQYMPLTPSSSLSYIPSTPATPVKPSYYIPVSPPATPKGPESILFLA